MTPRPKPDRDRMIAADPEPRPTPIADCTCGHLWAMHGAGGGACQACGCIGWMAPGDDPDPRQLTSGIALADLDGDSVEFERVERDQTSGTVRAMRGVARSRLLRELFHLSNAGIALADLLHVLREVAGDLPKEIV